jgi:hypothetical protein
MIELLAPSRQQPEVTPVVPFKNKIQCYQLKQSFLITLYYTTIFFAWHWKLQVIRLLRENFRFCVE